MTIKKSLISVVAAGALAAMVTGCGSSDSTSSSSSTSGGTTNSATVTAVDGYIINGTAKAYFLDENNDTQTITMDSTLHTTDSVDSTLDTVGAADYTLSDDTNKSLIRYYSIENKVLGLSGTTTTPATFIDDGSVEGKYDTNDTLFTARFTAGTKLYAPAAGFSVVSPLTNIVFNAVGGVTALEATEELNTTLIANKTEEVAAILGFDTATMKTTDPLDAISDNPTFAFVNTMISRAANPATFTTSLLKEANATSTSTFTDLIAKLSSAAEDAGDATLKGVFDTIANEIDLVGESDYVAAIPTLNLDDTAAAGGTAKVNSASTTAIANLNTIEINGYSADALNANGDKILATADLDTVTFDLDDIADANSSTTVDLYIQVQGGKSYNAGTAASDEVTIKVSGLALDNVDIAQPTLSDDNESVVKFTAAYQDQNSTAIGYYDLAESNATAAGISDFISMNGSTVTLKIKSLIADVESNISTTNSATLNADADLLGSITNVKIAIDADGKLAKANGTDNYLWGSTSIASVANPSNSNVSGNGKTLVSVTAADMRGDATGANTAPNYDANVTTANGLLTTAGVAVTANTVDYNGSTVVMNVDTTVADKNITLGFGKNDSNANEMLNTFTLSSASGIVTAIGAVTGGSGEDDVNGTNAGKVNLTLDSNSTLTSPDGSHPEYVFTYTPKDEFGKAGTERNVTIQLNRGPSITNTYYVLGEINATSTTTIAEYNTSIASTISDLDGNGDWNTTGGKLCISAMVNGGSTTQGYDVNTTIVDSYAGCMKSIQFQNGVADSNLTITIGDANSTGGFEVSITDTNATNLPLPDTKVLDVNLTLKAYDKFGIAGTSAILQVTLQGNDDNATAAITNVAR